MFKFDSLRAGGLFDGRVLGCGVNNTCPHEPGRPGEEHWTHNLVPVRDLGGPVSAYAVITPDGLWHECAAPEPHDLIVGPPDGVAWSDFIEPEARRRRLQAAWRSEVARLLQLHDDCWVAGMEAHLVPAPERVWTTDTLTDQPAEAA